MENRPKKPSYRSRKPHIEQYKVENDTNLLAFLCEKMHKNKAKQSLKNKQIRVNGEVQTHYNTELKIGDFVTRQLSTDAFEKILRDISLVYEDEYIIVIDKHAGLLSVSTDKENTKTAFRILSDHVKLEDPNNRIFIVHRLDRETSGLMVFAKSEEIKKKMQENWQDIVSERTYLAIVQGKPEPWSGVLKSYLYESTALKVHVTKDPEEGQLAVTNYKTIKSKGQFAMLKVWLDTGRKNQIRVQLNEIGHPILGDLKYGGKDVANPIGRLALHAWVLNFKHPVTDKEMEFQTEVPRKFSRIIG
jgi:23S rRNA pseudouridine1911/1915/1917 synthase